MMHPVAAYRGFAMGTLLPLCRDRFADPASGGGRDAETYPSFRAVAADLHSRIGYLLGRLGHAG